MPFAIWGATQGLRLLPPQRPLVGYIAFIFFLVAFVYLIYRVRADLRRLSGRQWLAVLVLSILSIVLSQLFPISLARSNQLPPPGTAQNPEAVLTLLAAIPFLLAGASINPGAALIVGFFSGLGRALGRTHYVYDPLFFAFAAVLAAWWMHQHYRGRVYKWLRHPIAAGTLGLISLVPLLFVAAYAYAGSETDSLVALDWAFSTARAQFLPLFFEGAFGGAVVALILLGVPDWRTVLGPEVAPPQQRSVRNRLLVNFAVFAVLVSFLLFFVVSYFSVRMATQLSVNQMAHDANTVSERIPEFRNQMQNLLQQYGDDAALLRADHDEVESHLAQLVRTAGAFYRRVIFVDASGEIRAFYPNRDQGEIALTPIEESAVSDSLARGAPSISPAQVAEGREHVLSFVVPVLDEAGNPGAVLVGRIPSIALNELIVGLQGTVGAGSGFVVDERNQIIAHPDETALLSQWTPADNGGRPLRFKVDAPGTAYEALESETNARQLYYEQQGPDHPWTVVIKVPHQVVLSLALQISLPLLAILVVGMAVFGLNLGYLGRNITAPLGKLVEASQRLAAGDWNVNVPIHYEDEVGKLGQAFERMRRSMQRQFNETKLMLDVSQQISKTIDLEEGIPAVLRGALRGTGALGARAVILNPSGRQPITFGEGPGSEMMSEFDRRIAWLVRQDKEIALGKPEQVRTGLRLDRDEELPMQALLAVALHAKGRFQGAFWLGYNQPHQFGSGEIRLMRTLASQASVLVENVRLFATAEGQRRRLAAVLASTSDAVIVTDQTDRVLLINPAMERAFRLRGNETVGRPVADVIQNQRLVHALTEREERVRNLEIQLDDDRILYASVSTILSNDNRTLGRVAVLHDITYLKELDDLKSEFVATVSHDLRNPLTFMRGYITMLPMVGDLNEKQEAYIDKILNGVQQMSSLIEDLLDLGRVEAGVVLMQDRIEAERLLWSVLEEMVGQAASSNLRLQVDVAPDVPAVYGDASLVRRAIVNLVGNATKYAPDSGTVTLRAEREGDEVVFSVHDHGPGIHKKDQIRLFEKFYRVQRKGQSTKGTGLGLAIVKSIAERHGGRAWVRSRVNQGSTFYLSLPLRRENGSEETDEGDEDASATGT